MRRTLLLLALLALALPAAALAGRRVIHGPAGGGSGTVDITLVTSKKGVVKKLTRFEFNNIQTVCKGSRTTTSAVSDKFPHTIPVDSDGSFGTTVKVNGGRATYTVEGDFKNKNNASGTLRVKGTTPGCGRSDTGKVHWTATHN
jgi:hypothetical protein